ncbi:MAG: response regulator [Pseudodesulfovibrio sp.]|uniref:Response regulator receiver n=1 Tax=Pseudodesulfovibrio aespoeensis (strain ATCC 700646 / DSM 10631 / Aspo-2) TaxID=643562 RepID=E6VSP0_PSEA9|nr:MULTISPECIES: response regulator [Pseudodesulfovibrio]MBU4378930.1 response regulator [Pseudomonadota bacterium]ADU62025.1 response regulator receiver [Pseudodesulfovibrio aespoeensis Aspo-2]MBU4474668.1 response regulator [Pseudomonadota bacterium]MBU4516005.1 response regulator [Pseudomonadota bacterium]MBU4522793.1 response regulator [Pseudomonadota bacterium]
MIDATILIVDDESGFVETMEKRLTKRNMTVFTAFNGDEAIQQLEKNPGIEVMVLDVKMPGKDGLTVLQEVKQAFPLVEVIMLTGHATVPSAIEGIQLGAYDYLMKPCSFDVLTEKIKEAVELKRTHEMEAAEARATAIYKRQA